MDGWMLGMEMSLFWQNEPFREHQHINVVLGRENKNVIANAAEFKCHKIVL